VNGAGAPAEACRRVPRVREREAPPNSDQPQSVALDPFTASKEIAMLAYDYPLFGVFWSLAFLFMFVMIGFIVIYAFVDNFRRPDHSGLAKAGWALLIIALPVLGALIYILARPEMRNSPLQPAV
jgi:hypothetical protein